MTRLEMDNAALKRACCGNELAMSFLTVWDGYIHAIDDIIDGEKTDAEHILATFAIAPVLYSHPFYLKNLESLRQIVLNTTNAYADSVAWEKSEHEWQREFADHYRHFGQEMYLAVVAICSYPNSYDHMRSVSQEARATAFLEHHTTRNGAPV